MLGIEHQTVFGLPPVEFVNLASDLGCRHIAIALSGGPYNPHGYEPYSLRDDAALRLRMTAAMRDRGVSISLGEGFTVRPGGDIRSAAADLDTMAELGVTRINTVSLDPDLGRSLDEFGTLAEMVGARGMETTVEFAPSLTVTDLDAAMAAVRHVARPDFRLLIDTMHLVRSGSSASDLAAIDPALIGYVQLSDNTIRQRGPVYREDSIDRMVPGEGELPLREILAVLPPDVVIGLEVPMRSRAEAGEPTQERARRCVRGARDLLAAQVIEK
jgi:sugar phosphate isomerase/epimerase